MVAGELAAARQPVRQLQAPIAPGLPFDAAAAVLPYLAELGITDLYTSPILQAAPGSTHGYDVIDHGSFNAELGGDEGYQRLASAARGRVGATFYDIVPKSHGPGRRKRALWMDLLENGPLGPRGRSSSTSSGAPSRKSWPTRCLRPCSATATGRVLERGEEISARSGRGGVPGPVCTTTSYPVSRALVRPQDSSPTATRSWRSSWARAKPWDELKEHPSC